MSLSGRPIGRSVYFSAAGTPSGPGTFVETDKAPPGWYHVQISTYSTDAGAPLNLQLQVGSTPWGIVPTGALTVAFVLVVQMEGSRSIQLRNVAGIGAGKVQFASIILTPIEAPPVVDWSYDSNGVPAP
jgi:hypothetical protein